MKQTKTARTLTQGYKEGKDEAVDALGFIQLASNDILAAAARGELDLNEIAKMELKSRGWTPAKGTPRYWSQNLGRYVSIPD